MPRTSRGNGSAAGTRLRIALAHDWLVGVRGGERVLETIAATLQAEHDLCALYTMFDDGGVIGQAVDAIPTVCWPMGRTSPALRLRRWMLPLYPRAVRYLSEELARAHQERPIDLLISSSSAAIKGLRAPDGVPHVCYCHSPARYIWSQEEQYRTGSWLRGAGLRLYRERFKAWDRATAANVTQFVANSRHSAAEIRRCFGRDSVVLHPPARTEYFTVDARVAREDFWLYVGALESYKNVALAIAAAESAGARLVIAGEGSDATRLRRLAKGKIEFLGRVSDADVRSLYRRARLVVFPQCEDFGIVAVEAQACGTPVVAFGMGGALDSVIDGVTGSLFYDPTPRAMLEAARRCPVDERACRTNAERFSEAAFATRLREMVQTRVTRRKMP